MITSGLGVVELVGEFEGARQRADRTHGPRRASECRRTPMWNCGQFGRKTGDAVALAHALRLQQCREAITLAVELSIGGDMPVSKDHGRPRRALLRPGAQIFRQGNFAMKIVWRSRRGPWARPSPTGRARWRGSPFRCGLYTHDGHSRMAFLVARACGRRQSTSLHVEHGRDHVKENSFPASRPMPRRGKITP